MKIKSESLQKNKKTSYGFYVLLFLFVVVSALVYARKSKYSTGDEKPLVVSERIGVKHDVNSDEAPPGVRGKIEVKQGVNSDTEPDDESDDEFKPKKERDMDYAGDVVSKQGKTTHVDYRPLLPFEKLIGKFNPNAPVTKDIPECLKKSGIQPTPSILMSIGRSGSTVILDMLSSLTKSQSDVIWREFVGQNIFDQEYFFNLTIPVEEKFESESKHINNVGLILKQSEARKTEVPAKDNFKHGKWMMNYLCRLQKQRPNELVGFQFKPLLYSFVRLKEARESMQLLASLASSAAAVEQEPPIVVIRSRRNTMDVFLSTMKHLGNSNLADHCAQGDEECLKHFKGEGKQSVDDIEFFYNKVLTMWGQENLIDRMLVELKVPHVPISYDTLYYPDQISDGEEEWNKLLQYIYPSSPRVSWADVQNAMDLAPTRSSRNHADIIGNWEEVYARFKGTEIEHLFRIDK
jgi:hypothetical protein